jgi:hypothetical protein
MVKKLLWLLLTLPLWGQAQHPTPCTALTTGQTCNVGNPSLGYGISLDERLAGAPSGVTITVQGGMNSGGLDSATNTCATGSSPSNCVNTATSNTIQKVVATTAYDYFLVTVTLTGGTSPSVTITPAVSTANAHSGGGATYTGTAPIVVSGTAISCPTCGTSTGTVTTVSVTTANGVSGSVANPTTTPAITVTLGAITPTSVTAGGSLSGSMTQGIFDYGTLTFSDADVVASYQASANNYVQQVMQNTSNGAAASTDYIVANDQGTATTHYGDFGINSSGFSGTGNLTEIAGETYLYATTGDLGLGTFTANAVHLVANNSATDAETITSSNVATFPSTGIALTGAMTAGHYLRNNATNYVDAAIAVGDLPAAIPIGNIGTAGLSGTSPVTINAAGAIGCATCATTTNGGALSGTAPIAVSAAGVISGGGLGTVTGALKGNGSGTITQAACADLSNGAAGCSASLPLSIANGGTGAATFAAHTWLGNNTGSTAALAAASIGSQDVTPQLYVAGGGTAQAQTVTLSPAVTSLVTGLYVAWKPTAANTAGAPTLAVNGLATTTITKCGTTALQANDIITAAVAYAIYDGTEFQLLNPQAVACGTSTLNKSGTYAANNALYAIGAGTTIGATANIVYDAAQSYLATYNAIATVNHGVPEQVATVDSSNSAAITATTLYTPGATGQFRISASLIVTTAATTSSILGGTTGVVITYTDGTSSAAQSVTMYAVNQSAAVITIGTGNTGNTTTSQYLCTPIYIYAKTGVPIQYAIGYTSVGGTAMVYEAHVLAEKM